MKKDSPFEPLKLSSVSAFEISEAVALVKPTDHKKETVKELQKIVKQHNYTNMNVQLLGQQLTRIESA